MRVPSAFLAALIVVSPWDALRAQSSHRPAARAEIYAGAELETYLRNLQVLGVVRPYPWSVRRFTAQEVDRLLPRDEAHPWTARYDWRPAPSGRASIAVARPEVALRVNSGFPYGYNDGAIWAGRGLTASGQGGVVASYGPLAATFVPLVSWASNGAFPLRPNGQTGKLVFADGGGIDHPQRFGSGPYAVLSGGQSALDLSGWGAAAGVSTASDWWGPASEFPVILGNNAGGFPHVFAGTAAPVNLWIARVHTRAVFGRLTQSAYASPTGPLSARAASGAVVVVEPRWPPGLEVGGTRFIHRVWANHRSLVPGLLSPFGYGTSGSHNVGAEDVLTNQLASIFVRWVVPRSGVEIYGEYGTEDYRYDLREALGEPDHNAGYTIGLRHAWQRDSATLHVLHAEIQNLQPGTLVQEAPPRWQGSFYVHTLAQGHTYEGQILGSEWGYGGAAAKVALDSYHPGGRWTVAWSRLLRAELAGGSVATAPENPRGLDVMHTLGVEGLFFRGRYDITAGATAVYEFNRDFRRDAFNLNLYFAARASL